MGFRVWGSGFSDEQSVATGYWPLVTGYCCLALLITFSICAGPVLSADPATDLWAAQGSVAPFPDPIAAPAGFVEEKAPEAPSPSEDMAARGRQAVRRLRPSSARARPAGVRAQCLGTGRQRERLRLRRPI